jgi:hypothetical protein
MLQHFIQDMVDIGGVPGDEYENEKMHMLSALGAI